MTRIAFWLCAMIITVLIVGAVCYLLAKDTGLTSFPTNGKDAGLNLLPSSGNQGSN